MLCISDLLLTIRFDFFEMVGVQEGDGDTYIHLSPLVLACTHFYLFVEERSRVLSWPMGSPRSNQLALHPPAQLIHSGSPYYTPYNDHT